MRQLIQLEKQLTSKTTVIESDFIDDWGSGVLFVKVPDALPSPIKLNPKGLDSKSATEGTNGAAASALPTPEVKFSLLDVPNVISQPNTFAFSKTYDELC